MQALLAKHYSGSSGAGVRSLAHSTKNRTHLASTNAIQFRVMNTITLQDYFTDAIKFWEPRRVVYNLVLAAIVVLYFVASDPVSRTALSLDFALQLFLLAVVANIAYCAAYLVDVFVQASGLRDVWLRIRWVLFAIGTTFAAIIARFVSMGMFHRA
ncbi:MAG: hypothetical protein AUG89_05855 [Acidobacteria bacterium 13_1_20CM_4_56_7]|nr:MAG: hypothetical protein AUG89_05855 [Acidobacteria bacterium 13_1_20CM_4_56_7]PYV52117.1 MAG: hypothetical protein DMG92_02010 [Acidobacteriota bacterium]